MIKFVETPLYCIFGVIVTIFVIWNNHSVYCQSLSVQSGVTSGLLCNVCEYTNMCNQWFTNSYMYTYGDYCTNNYSRTSPYSSTSRRCRAGQRPPTNIRTVITPAGLRAVRPRHSRINTSNLINIQRETTIPTVSYVRMGHINTRSACDVSKRDQIKDLIIDSSLDLCAITETWFSTTYHPKTVSPPGYTAIQCSILQETTNVEEVWL